MTARLSDALLPPGLAADLPADPGIVPAFYSATDTGRVWRWDGTTWTIWALALPEGTTDGDVPVWDATAGLWVPGTGGGGGSSTGQITRLRISANQPAALNTWTTVSWNTESQDDLGLHDNTTNPTRITIPSGQSGSYIIGFTLSCLITGGSRFMGFYKNGVRFPGRLNFSTGEAQLVHPMTLAATDYIEAAVYTSVAGSIVADGGDGSVTMLTATRVG